MSRPRSVPDAQVLAAVRALLRQGGDKAVAFSAVAEKTGLAPASLAQRYGSVQGMIAAAASDGVDQALAGLARLEADAPEKGPQGLLKALADLAPDPVILAVLMRSAEGRDKATAFRTAAESAIARRLGAKQAAAAPMLFAAWAGLQAWSGTGQAGFKLKDVVKRLG